MFIVYAPNVASGGGLVLLRALITAFSGRSDVVLMLDERGRSSLQELAVGLNCRWYKSSIRGRFSAELALRKLASNGDIVFCFHNLPPIFRSKGRIICYVHNANLVGMIPTKILSGWVRLRYLIERQVAFFRRLNVERYVVQTPTMRSALASWYGRGVPPIDVLPFIGEVDSLPKNEDSLGPSALSSQFKWDFVYVSDGSAHKNHQRLLDAWQILAEEGRFPTLALTLNPQRDTGISEKVKRAVVCTGVNIHDLGQMRHEDVLKLYLESRALIFPSLAESLGIPLIEASIAGLPIVASELDYVRDVCVPAETFNPQSARSIARAVSRFLDGPDAIPPFLNGTEFIEHLTSRIGA